MSGIVACFHRDLSAVDREDLGKMLETIPYRGPDGLTLWSEGAIGLGHARLCTTPESLREKQPWVEPQSGCVITADARIDNRTELIEIFQWQGQDPLEISDSQLILHAYLRWGRECPSRLLGDFAFGIWDPRHSTLFAARDPMGVKPLYVHCSDQLLALGSEIVALLSLKQIPHHLNETRLAGYLVQRRGLLLPIMDEYTPTLYQEISPLPPGHTLWVSPDQHQRQIYWQLDMEREIRLESNEAYAEAFREIFTQAVSCRLRSASPVGAIVSGGLDSSSVACVARECLQHATAEPLHLFSAIFPNLSKPEQRVLDERPYLDLLRSQPGVISHLFEADQLSPLRDQDQVYYHADDWLTGNNLYLMWHAYRLAAQQGIRVTLDGIDGDNTVSHGFGHLKELAQAKQWAQLIQHRRVAHLYHGSPWQLVWDYFWAYQVRPTCIRGPLRPIWQRLQHREYPAILNPDFAERTQIQERFRQFTARKSQYRGVKQEHYYGLSAGMLQAGLISIDRIAARIGIEPRHPFFDRRLVEFCLALPTDQKLAQGWSRVILRRAMDQTLPAAIQWRPDKADLSPCFNRNFMLFEQSYLKEILETQTDLLQPYLDLEVLKTTYIRCLTFLKGNQYTNSQMGADCTLLWYVALLTHWLKHQSHL